LFLIQSNYLQITLNMEANIKRSWDEIAQTVQTLPKSWPSKLVFVTPPTIMSRPYSPSSNPLQPNDGPCRLETADPNNQDFLQLQMSVARNIELYQNFSTTLAIAFVEDLRGISDGLDALKRDHWEEGRRTYHFGMQVIEIFWQSCSQGQIPRMGSTGRNEEMRREQVAAVLGRAFGGCSGGKVRGWR
jgi:hypothetical protein